MISLDQWLHKPAASVSAKAKSHAEHRQTVLTKPPGALGQLEKCAIQLAALQGRQRPALDKITICVFAGDHGIASEGISAFPQAVTAEMVKNFARGGAAICVMARHLGATLEVINLGTVAQTGPLDGVINLHLGSGTRNFTQQPAMDADQLARAMKAGFEAVERARATDAGLFIGGEMGIGNTTSATALACAFLDEPPGLLAGPGTGLDQRGIAHKVAIIQKALDLHGSNDPLETLRRLGGFEIAALTGSYIASAQQGLPVLIDGYISSVAALAAQRICPGSGQWFLYSHRSAEPGHKRVLDALQARPLLNLGMRLGEGSGAAVAVPLLRAACALHNEMATFDEAEVSKGDA